jgi:hypothetical protein
MSPVFSASRNETAFFWVEGVTSPSPHPLDASISLCTSRDPIKIWFHLGEVFSLLNSKARAITPVFTFERKN